MVYLNFIKDIKMKTTISSHSLQSKLWMALLVSVVGLSACSNEVEETPDSTMDTTEATAAEVGTNSLWVKQPRIWTWPIQTVLWIQLVQPLPTQ